MHAVKTHRYGTTDVLELIDLPRPSVGPKEVLIQVHASPITEGDRRVRSGDFPGASALLGRLVMGLTGPRNQISGSMWAGRVVEIGSEVTRYGVGDDVFGSVDHSAHAEFLCLPEEAKMTRMPSGMTYAEAAAIPYGAGTALLFLRDLTEVKRGEHVLILGASGGVGRYAIQIAKDRGADVTAVCSSRHADLVRSLGADHVVDYQTTDIHRLASRYDVVIDLADATTFPRIRHLLTDSGRYATVYISLNVLFWMAMTAFTSGQRALFTIAMPNQQDHEDLAALMERRVITPHIAHRVPLARIRDAYLLQETTREAGEVVVDVTEPAALRAVG